MDKICLQEYRDTQCIQTVTEDIIKHFAPQRVYLYNQRHSHSGRIMSFKLCMVLETQNKQEAEIALYRDINCDVPFDILIYTPKEWEELSAREDTFASRISRTGLMIHG